MDAIKSYFSKIMSQSHVIRKGSDKWKRDRSKDCGRFGKIPHRSASTSHVDLDSHDPDMDAISMGSLRMFTPTLDTFRPPQRGSDRGSSLAGQQSRRDMTRTPPPSKPPRRDLVFSVQLDTEGLNDIGVEIDSLPTQATASPKLKSSEADSSKQEDNDSPTAHDESSTGNHARCHGLTFKVVALTQGSRCNLDGRVKVNDEIVDINGESLHKETRESARVLLEKAIKSGHVVLTIRRRRKRAAGPPAVPTRQTSLLQSSHRTWSASSDDLCSTELPSAPNGFTTSSNTRTRSLDDSLLPEPVLLEDLNVDLNISSDDVFLDSTTPHEKVTYANLPHLRFHKNKHSRTNERLPDVVRSDTCKQDKTDNIFASEDVSSCSSKASDDSPRPEYFLPKGIGKPLRRCSSTSTLVDEFDSKIESSSSSRKESVESTDCTSVPADQPMPDRHNDRVTTFLPTAAKNILRHSEHSQNREDDTAHQMSMSTHENDADLPNSPSLKKRMVSKLNLLKDENGLGIHIAGGKGSKKGDIGIFIAAVTEGGAADRDGRLKKGDELLMINGHSLEGLSHQEAVDVLRNSEHLVKIVIASKIKKTSSIVSPSHKLPDSPKMVHPKRSVASQGEQKCKLKLNHLRRPSQMTSSESNKSGNGTVQPEVKLGKPQSLELQAAGDSHGREASSHVKHNNADKSSPCGTATKWEEYFEKFQPVEDNTVLKLMASKHHSQHRQAVSIMIPKGAGGMGLGFSVIVDPDPSTGNSGIFVEKIFTHGGIAKDGRLNEGDELLAINDQPVSGMTHEAVMSLFRSLKQGPVKVTFRPRIASSKKTSSCVPYSKSLDDSPASTPDQPPYTSLQNDFIDASAAANNKLNNQKQSTHASSFSNKQAEKQVNSKSQCDSTSYKMPVNAKDPSSVKNDYNAVDKQCLPKEPFLPAKHNFNQKPVDKGRVGVVTPLPNQSEGGSCQRNEHLSQAYSNPRQGHTFSTSQTIKPQDSSNLGQKKSLSCHKENQNSLESKYNHHAELEKLLQNCMDKNTALLPYGIVSSPKSSSVVKMQVRPVETHVAQSSPVMNLHSFKPAGIAVKYPPSEKDVKTNKQVFSTPTAKRKEYNHSGNDKTTKSETQNSADGIVRLAETRIHPDYKTVESPTVRPKFNHNAQTVTHKSVDRVDQQLRENRKQIDVSSPIIGQRRNCPTASAPIKDLAEVHADTFSTQSKTLPRLHHQNSVESCHHQILNSVIGHQQTTALEESPINEQKISTAPFSRKHSEGSMSPGCYSSLPRGHHHPHHNHQQAEHCQACHNQQPGHHGADNSIHTSNIHSSGKSFAHAPHLLQNQFSATDLLLPDLMRQTYAPQLSLKPFDNAALTFFNHNQAFSRLHSAPNSLMLMDNNTQFPNFNSSAFNQENNMATSPTTSFNSFTQASFYKYQSKEATATFQSNSTSEKQSHTVYGNSQSFSNVVNPHASANSPDLLSNSMLPLINLPQMVSAKRMTESAYGDFSSQNKNNQNFISAKEKLAWLQDMCNWHRFEVSIIKEAGITFGINIVRKTVAGASNIFIQDIIPGSNVEKDNRLRKGDCLLSVNGVELKDFTLLDAYELFRTLSPGPVHVIAIRDMGHTTV